MKRIISHYGVVDVIVFLSQKNVRLAEYTRVVDGTDQRYEQLS